MASPYQLYQPLLGSGLGSWGAKEAWQAQLGVQQSFWRQSTHRPPRSRSDLWFFPSDHLRSVLLQSVNVQLGKRCHDDQEIYHSNRTHKTKVTWYRMWTRKKAHTSALTKAASLSFGRYQVPDMVFPKHGPTFCSRLWPRTMLLRGGIHGSTVRGNVGVNSTVPQRLDPAKRFRPASRWHLKTTNTIDPLICHWNLRSSVRSTTSTIPILSHDQNQRLLPNSPPNDRFSAQESNASGRSCMHEVNPCAQLHWFKMAPDYPGIGWILLSTRSCSAFFSCTADSQRKFNRKKRMTWEKLLSSIKNVVPLHAHVPERNQSAWRSPWLFCYFSGACTFTI